jgi:hypothetical protein
MLHTIRAQKDPKIDFLTNLRTALAGRNRVRFVPPQPVDDKTLFEISGVSQVERKERYTILRGPMTWQHLSSIRLQKLECTFPI